MLRGAVCTCFFGLLQPDEMVVPTDGSYDPSIHLLFGDLRLDNARDPQFLEVMIKASKTDPFRQGVKIYLGHTDTDICPVAVLLGYMAQRGMDSGVLQIHN